MCEHSCECVVMHCVCACVFVSRTQKHKNLPLITRWARVFAREYVCALRREGEGEEDEREWKRVCSCIPHATYKCAHIFTEACPASRMCLCVVCVFRHTSVKQSRGHFRHTIHLIPDACDVTNHSQRPRCSRTAR
jgi:hypothetical protein